MTLTLVVPSRARQQSLGDTNLDWLICHSNEKDLAHPTCIGGLCQWK